MDPRGQIGLEPRLWLSTGPGHELSDVRGHLGPWLLGGWPSRPRPPIDARFHSQIARGLAELGVHVLPFADAQVVQVFGSTHPAERRARQLALLLPQVVPEVHQGQEVRRRFGEARVLGVGGVPSVGRAFSRVLNRQRGGDDQDLG